MRKSILRVGDLVGFSGRGSGADSYNYLGIVAAIETGRKLHAPDYNISVMWTICGHEKLIHGYKVDELRKFY